jgi:broad specificity phosphatase PhoE
VSENDRLPPVGIRQRGPVPSGTRLFLVRHGESYANARGVAGGPLGDGGLTPVGQAQAQALRDRLVRSRELATASALYTSVLPRAIETAQWIAPALPEHLVAVADEVFNEISVGEADNLPWGELEARFGPAPDWNTEPHRPMAPGGESLLDFFERCERALTQLVERHPGELVVVVCHGGVIEQAMKKYHGYPGSRRLFPRIENCSLTEIEARPEGWRLLRYNDVVPLSAE